MKNPIRSRQFQGNLVALLAALFTLSGCVWQDLEECPPPPTGKVSLNLTFTLHHTLNPDGTYDDLFADYAESVEIFIFDTNGLFIKKITDLQGPFAKNYLLPIVLPVGQYRAVTWVNLASNPAISLTPEPREGITTYDEIRVRLQPPLPGTSDGQLSPLFYGSTQTFTVFEATTGNQEITIPSGLTCDTKRARFDIGWHDKTTGKRCELSSHADSTRLYVDDESGTLGFDNLFKPSGTITYTPTYQTGASPTDTGAGILSAEVDILRLIIGSGPRLRVCRLLPDGSEKQVYEVEIMRDFISPLYKTQEEIDRKERFHIEMEFACEHTPNPTDETWIATRISINDWVLVDNGDVEL